MLNRRSTGFLKRLFVFALIVVQIGCFGTRVSGLCQLSAIVPTQDGKQAPGVPELPASNSIATDTPSKPLPFKVSLIYSEKYLIDLGGLERTHPFDIRKYEKIHKELIKAGGAAADDFVAPSRLSDEELRLVHSEKYLKSLKDREKLATYLEAPQLKLIPMDLTRAVVEPFRIASGGTLLAARRSLESGIAVNIGGGYHHAKPDVGEGFCVFADVPIAIRQLQKEKKIRTALVIDVDVHQGNGTAVCLANDDTTYTFSMQQEGIYPQPREKSDWDIDLPAGMKDAEYLQILKESIPTIFQRCQPDICFIVGGCDTLDGDPLANLQMTQQGIVDRDAIIVAACVDRKIPVVLTLSGGYSKNAWRSQFLSIKNLVDVYGLANTEK